MSRRRTFWVLSTVVIAAGLAGAGLYAADVWPIAAEPAAKSTERLMAEPAAPRLEPAGPVLEAAAAEDTGALPAEALDALATVTELGGHVGAAVVELSTGDPVYERNSDDAFVPASTMKILTSVAALEVLGPDHRFATTVVTQPDAEAGAAEITLVGGGDPLLASTEDAAMTPSAATLEELADATAKALAGTEAAVRLTFDDSLFSGPAIDPDWRPNYVPDGVAAPVSALSVDGARSTPGLRWRVDDPAQAAAELFAGMLDDRGVPMADEPLERATPHPDAEPLAVLSSPPLSAIVEYLIQTSNNDVAEAVARHVPLGLDRPGSAEEASDAVPEVLADLGIDLNRVRIDDGSGLARTNRVTVSALVATLAAAAHPEHPELRPAVTGLPVAGFSGSLADRAGEGGAGYVRAKTGTLTGVHSLAGIAVTPDGAVYLFAIIADDADDALGARAALDDFAAALAAGMP